MGVNLYGGQRGNGDGSTRASSHLLEGPGDISSFPYYRKYFSDAMIPTITRVHRELTNIAASTAIHLDPILVAVCSKLLGVDQREICNRSILTMGLPKQNLSFLNTVHRDHNDKIPTPETREEAERLLTDKKELQFYESWCQIFHHLSVPTTCCYLHVGNLPPSSERQRRTSNDDEGKLPRVLLFMIFVDLGIAIPIDHNMVLQFAANVTAHHTSAAVVVRDKIVYYRSDDFTVVGWGGSGAAIKSGIEPATRKRRLNNMKRRQARKSRVGGSS